MNLGYRALVEEGLQDLVVLHEVVLELCVEVDLFHLDIALRTATPSQSNAGASIARPPAPVIWPQVHMHRAPATRQPEMLSAVAPACCLSRQAATRHPLVPMAKASLRMRRR